MNLLHRTKSELRTKNRPREPASEITDQTYYHWRKEGALNRDTAHKMWREF